MPPVERDELIMALMKDIDQENDPELWNETLEAFEKASDRELNDWYNQQNDPGQARENAYEAATQVAKPDIWQDAGLDISDAERDAIMKELANDLGDLGRALTQEQDQMHDQNQMLEHDAMQEQEDDQEQEQ